MISQRGSRRLTGAAGPPSARPIYIALKLKLPYIGIELQ